MAINQNNSGFFGGGANNNSGGTGDGPGLGGGGGTGAGSGITNLTNNAGDGSGGGGGYTGGGVVTPTTTTTTSTTTTTTTQPYLPTGFATSKGDIILNLTADEAVEFSFIDQTGFPKSFAISNTYQFKRNHLQFHGPYIFRAQNTGTTSLNRFSVSVEREQNTAKEYFWIVEQEYNPTTQTFSVINERKITTNTIVEELHFRFSSVQTSTTTTTTTQPQITTTTTTTTTTTSNPVVNYEIAFATNFNNELGNNLTLKYNIVDKNGNSVDSDSILLQNKNTDNKKIVNSIALNSNVNIQLIGTFSSEYKYTHIYYTNSRNVKSINNDFSTWTEVSGPNFTIPGKELLSSIAVVALFEKTLINVSPILTLDTSSFDVEVKESDTDKQINIPFSVKQADFVDVYITKDNIIRVPANNGFANLFFKKDFGGIYGSKRIVFVPVNNTYGTGNKVEVIINFKLVNDFPSIVQILYPTNVEVPSFSDGNIDWEIHYQSFAATSVDVDLLARDKSRIPLFKNLKPNDSFKINLKELGNKFSNWNGNDTITLVFRPINRGGEHELIGNEYEVITSIVYPKIQLDEDIIRKSIFDAFMDKLKFTEPELESKYLTHLLNFGDDQHLLISSWEEDNWTLSDKQTDELGNVTVTNEVKSLILKLYSPLPAEYQTNQTVWVTKLMTNPLVETIILNEESNIECPNIKGPNFNIDVDYIKGASTTFESLDSLILSATSSAELISTYLSSSFTNTDDLNIQYVSGSLTSNPSGSLLKNGIIIDSFAYDGVYQWDNFVHFSSAKDRVDNFVYKVQLIESYNTAIVKASTNYTGGGGAYYTASVASTQEVQRQQSKKSKIIQSFDGFEKFLYTYSADYSNANSSSITWPIQNGALLASTTNVVIGWYNNIINIASDYDKTNTNHLLNNIPQYILANENNDNYLLFFSMIGHHFDNIYYYTKAVERGRGLGYKSKNGITDRLLFDVLKSLSWDAKHLSPNTDLWHYVFGTDVNGTSSQQTPAKQRNAEIWRRIVNNIPYLLKHRGTRRGIYAMMACYGIPSSNLSVIEFGGPEVTDEVKHKLIMSDIAYNILMSPSASIQIPWKNTEQNKKPNSIEIFLTPARSGYWNVISGSNWGVSLSGSIGSSLGTVIFNYSGSNAITSSVLPIFNTNYFGIEISKIYTNSGSASLELNVKQTDVDRTIFSGSYTKLIQTASIAMESGSYIYIGSGSNGFSGSIDEIRLWSTALSSSKFFEHCHYPEMINGNNISSSYSDLYFRLDFEYPKNVALTSSFINVSPTTYYSGTLDRNYYESGNGRLTTLASTNISASLSASAFGFTSATAYPYQFQVIERDVVLATPDLGVSRYSTNKIRNEDQILINDLSPNYRSTIQTNQLSPGDTNRVGIFLSTAKEINLDIARSIGAENLDNYIGNPDDLYEETYKPLESLRNYYFKRYKNRDVYSYIDLIKLYEKAMFDDIKQMLPARVAVATGLLIEPHFLERNKLKHKRPSVENNQINTVLNAELHTVITSEIEQFNTVVDCHSTTDVNGESVQLEKTINTEDDINTIANEYQLDTLIANTSPLVTSENYEYYSTIINDTAISSYNEQYECIIDSHIIKNTVLSESELNASNTIIDDNSLYNTIGYGIYLENGSAIRTYYDANKNKIKERIKVYVVKVQKQRVVTVPNVVVNGKGDARMGLSSSIQTYYDTTLVVQPFEENYTVSSSYDANNLPITFLNPNSMYQISSYNPADDFSNIGGPAPAGGYNGMRFIAKGTTPKVWTATTGTGLIFVPKTTYAPFSGSGNIVEVSIPSGYLSSHYSKNSLLTTGMKNAYYRGCKNTAATTLDGTPPIEVFTTNPNAIKVNKAGRDISEPILEVG